MKIYKGISYAKNARTTMRRNVAARIISVRSSVTSREEDRPCSLSVSGPRCWSYSEDGAGLSLSSSTGTHLEWSSVHSGLYRGGVQSYCACAIQMSVVTHRGWTKIQHQVCQGITAAIVMLFHSFPWKIRDFEFMTPASTLCCGSKWDRDRVTPSPSLTL